MGELHSALGDISRIRRQMARTTEFRGYGPATLAVTGGIALAAAVVQAVWLGDAARHVDAFVAIWVGCAAVSAAVTGTGMVTRSRRLHSGLSNQMLRLAVEQFLPAVVAGVLLTAVLLRFAPAEAWLLPGLWQVIYGLGVFSSCRFLPRPMMAVGAWYGLTGLACVALADARALGAWWMGVPFGVGQGLAAGVLWAFAPEVDDDIEEG